MKIRFVIPGIPLVLRAVLFTACELGGLYYQFYIGTEAFSGAFFLSLLIMFCGVLPLLAKNYRNKPEDLGFEDWQPVTRNEYTRIKDNLLATREMRIPFYFNMAAGSLFVIGIVITLFICTITEAFVVIPYIIDAGIILLPVFFSGLVALWTPSVIRLKIPAFDAIFSRVAPDEKSLILTPYLRFDKDKQGKKIPEDLRFMLEPRRKPEDFMGVQIQAAINNGPNGAVPYLYAVFLCKGQGKTFALLKKQKYGRFINEPGGDDQYGFMVVRQQTTGGGYYTSPENCVTLYRRVRTVLDGLHSALKN
jgi:hypothetical protein